ncbi:MAG: hypothetical protein EBS18_06235 [Actinobacteria bacterium]|nr:hypothetical protein [Actinomycetota bacterium]
MQLMKYTAEMPIVDFAPAKVLVSGKTLVDKKLSVIEQASGFTLAALVAEKGKVGTAARNGMAMDGLCRIASATFNGNYRPLAEYISALTGESLTIANRSTYESLIDRFQDRINDLKDQGMIFNKKKGVVIEGAKRKAYSKVIAALEAIQQATAEEFARRNA